MDRVRAGKKKCVNTNIVAVSRCFKVTKVEYVNVSVLKLECMEMCDSFSVVPRRGVCRPVWRQDSEDSCQS